MTDPFADHPHDSTPLQSPGKSPFAPGSPFAAHYLPPRLGIIHLLAWTAATALLVIFWMATTEMIGDDGGDSIPRAIRVAQQVVWSIQLTALAAGLVGTGILLLAKIRRLRGRFQPGHWLLLISTLIWAPSLLVPWALFLLIGTPDSVDTPSASSLVWISRTWNLVTTSTSFAAYFFATFVCKAGNRWRICFAVLAAFGLMQTFRYVGALFSVSLFWWTKPLQYRSLIVGAVLLMAVLIDLRRGPRRDWLHWLGVAIIATGVLLSVAWWVWSTFAARLME